MSRDRFIPRRPIGGLGQPFNSNLFPINTTPHESSDPDEPDSPTLRTSRNIYSSVLKSEIFDTPPRSNSTRSLPQSPERFPPSLGLPTTPRKRVQPLMNNSILKFSPSKLIRSESDLSDISNSSSILRPESRDILSQPVVKPRVISKSPTRVLEAPNLREDFYLNLVEWGPSGKLAVGLGNRVYLWDPITLAVAELCCLNNDEYVSSVSWMASGEYVSVGSSTGLIFIYDAETCQKLRTMTGHSDRASSLSWNEHILTSGGRDQHIIHRDVRVRSHYISSIQAHYSEVCGLKWNVDLQLLASGANDNKVKIWSASNIHDVDPRYCFDEHEAAVKGLAWSPHQRGVLATGGGYLDRTIKIWNCLQGKMVSSYETDSQICNLAWSPHYKELITAQGNERNEVIVWKYPQMSPIVKLRDHKSRVLHLSLSPTGSSLVTGAGDETIRLWSMYDEVLSRESSAVDIVKQLR